MYISKYICFNIYINYFKNINKNEYNLNCLVLKKFVKKNINFLVVI